MFERFTEEARQVLVLAQEEARTLSHDYIGAEHFLLGLLRSGGSACAGLQSMGVGLDEARQSMVDDHIGDEHLLCAVLAQRDGVPAEVLSELGVDRDAL